MASRLSFLNGPRPAQNTSTTTSTNTPTAAPANAAPPPAQNQSRPLDAFTRIATTVAQVAQQPAVQNVVNTGLRMMLGVNASQIAQRLQSLLPQLAPLPPAQARAQAQADMSELMSRNPPPATTEVVALLAQHPNDPEYAASLIGAIPDERKPGMLFDAANGMGTAGGRDGQQMVLSAMKLARDHQPPLLNMNALQEAPNYNASIDSGMNAISDPAGTLRGLAMNSVEVQATAIQSLTATSQATHAKLQELDAQLGRELARFGPGLTQAQKDAYTTTFKAQHPEYATADASDKNLATFMRGHQVRLQQAALDPSNPGAMQAAQALSKAYESLAGSAQNQLVADALQVPGLQAKLAASYGGAVADFEAKVVQPTAESLMTSAATGESPDRILEQLNGIYSNMTQVPELADDAKTALTAFGELAKALGPLKTWGGKLDGASEAGKKFGEQLNAISEDAGSTSGVGKLIAGGGFIMGLAMMTEGALGNNPQAGQELMQGMMQSLENSPAIGYGLEILADRFPKVISEELAKGVTDTLENATDFLGAVTSTLSFLDSMAQVTEGQATTGDKMKLLSDTLGMVGGIATLVGGNVFAATAGVLAAVTSLAGDAIKNAEQQETNRQFDDETWKILTDPSFQPPVDSNVLQTLRDLPEGGAQAIAKNMDFTPEQFVTYAAQLPVLAEAALDPVGTAATQRMRNELGLSPDQIAQFAGSAPEAFTVFAMTPQGQAVSNMKALQSTLGLTPAETLQLMTDIARTSGRGFGDVLNQANGAIQSGGDPRAALQRLRANVSAPDIAAGLDLILSAAQP